jgi:lipoyl(octanoyl) transferase
MTPASGQRDRSAPALAAYLLGPVDFEICLALQQRLVYEAGGRQDGQISLLFCEHLPAITVGRHGSRLDIRYSPRTLASEGLTVRWVNRGGGALAHAPGQLAVYPIVPLAFHGWSVGGYLDRLQAGIAAALAELGFHGQPSAREWGLWGRTGQIASVGVAVKNWITYYGAYVNVSPARRVLSAVRTATSRRAALSSLAIERQQSVKMSRVREGLVRHLAASFGSPRFHLHTGHALLAPTVARHVTTARAS